MKRLWKVCVRVCDDGCVVETEGGVEDKQGKKREEKDRNLLFHSKILKLKAKEEGLLTRCQWAKMEDRPTPNCLRVSVTYRSLQRVLIEKNVRTVGFADGDFVWFFQWGQMEARR